MSELYSGYQRKKKQQTGSEDESDDGLSCRELVAKATEAMSRSARTQALTLSNRLGPTGPPNPTGWPTQPVAQVESRGLGGTQGVAPSVSDPGPGPGPTSEPPQVSAPAQHLDSNAVDNVQGQQQEALPPQAVMNLSQQQLQAIALQVLQLQQPQLRQQPDPIHLLGSHLVTVIEQLKAVGEHQTAVSERAEERIAWPWYTEKERQLAWFRSQLVAMEDDGYEDGLWSGLREKIKAGSWSIPKTLMFLTAMEPDKNRRLAFAYSLLHDEEMMVINRYNWQSALHEGHQYCNNHGDKILKLNWPLLPPKHMSDLNHRLFNAVGSVSGAGVEKPLFAGSGSWGTHKMHRVYLKPTTVTSLEGAGYKLFPDPNDGSIDIGIVESAMGDLMSRVANMESQSGGLASNVSSLQQQLTQVQRELQQHGRSSSPRRTGAPAAPRLCHSCGQPGHFSKRCPLNQQPQQYHQPQQYPQPQQYGQQPQYPRRGGNNGGSGNNGSVYYMNSDTNFRQQHPLWHNFPRPKVIKLDDIEGGDYNECLRSEDLDAFLSHAYAVERDDPNAATPVIFPANCSLDIFSNVAYENIFREADGPILIPFHSHHHWIAVAIRLGKFMIADSAPQPAVLADLDKLFALAKKCMGQLEKVIFFVPRQPHSSNECGVHTAVNLMHMLRGHFNDCRGKVLSYGQLRPVLQNISEGGVCAEALIQGARMIAKKADIFFTEPLVREHLVYVVDRFSAAGVNKVTVVYLNNDEYQFMEHTLVKRKNGRWMTDKGMLPQARTDNCKEYIALIDSKTFLEIRGREELRYPVSRTCLNLSPVISPPVVMATKSKVRPPDLVQLPPPEPVHAVDDPLLSPDLPQFHDLLAKNVYPPDCVLYRSGDQITMAELVKILELQEVKEIPALYEKALEWSTRTAHLRVLRWLCANVKTEGAVDAAILKAVQDAAAARAWAATTTMTKMTSIQGALKALFLYRPQQISIQLKNCTRWLLALKGLNAMVQLHQTQQPKAVTEAQLLEACRMEPKLVIRAALETAWLWLGLGLGLGLS